MKLLMIYTDKFAYKANTKNLESVESYEENNQIENALVGFIQVEQKDEEDIAKADEKITKEMFNRAEQRLMNSGYIVSQTPFGYFLDLDIQAPGKSLARVFKEF